MFWWTMPAEPVGHLGQGEPDVVVEGEHGALLQGQPTERTFQLVAIVHRQECARLELASSDRSRIWAVQRLRRLASA